MDLALQARNSGVMTVNEARRYVNLPDVDGGNELMLPMSTPASADTGEDDVDNDGPSVIQPEEDEQGADR